MGESHLTHLECSMTGERYPAGVAHGLSRVGRPLLARYDLGAVARAVSVKDLGRRPSGLWRYQELLPVRSPENRLTLGEEATPIVAIPEVQRGAGTLWVKDESRLPTGSFKARGLCVAVSMARELGLNSLAMPSNGNAGSAMAAYAARAGIDAYVFCPEDTPEINLREIALQGAKVWRVNGLINDCGKIVADGQNAMGWFDLSTLKEPYRIEGKKTMGLELCDQLGWNYPDVIIYPTGGGTGLIGMWKAFGELAELGWCRKKPPRMVAAQAEGCAPIVKAFDEGAEHAPPWPNAHTVAAGIRVPVAVGDFLMIRALRESGGFALAVDDDAILAARDNVALETGLLLCPEGAATFAVYERAIQSGRISPNESVMLFNCASGLKYPLPAMDRRLDRFQPIEYRDLQHG